MQEASHDSLINRALARCPSGFHSHSTCIGLSKWECKLDFPPRFGGYNTDDECESLFCEDRRKMGKGQGGRGIKRGRERERAYLIRVCICFEL